ncbi:MAG TPA: GxxExxY protein [Chitinophagaceae bacterium]|nr:GxxExxY protein [Chitinophagaceae bacterium]
MENGSLLYQEASYQIIGIAMEVHRELGPGLKEVNYQDALEYEFQLNKIPYQREKRYRVTYKGKVLSRPYVADFLIADKIILEIKSVPVIIDQHFAQTLNYLKVSGTKLGLILNFGAKSLAWQRVVL